MEENKKVIESKEQLEVKNKLLAEVKKEEESREVVRILLKESTGMLWGKNVEGRYVYANRQVAEKLYHIKPSQMEGYTDIELTEKYFKGEGKAGSICAGTDDFTFTMGRSCSFVEMFSKGKYELFLYVIKTPIYGTDGNAIGTVGMALNGLNKQDLLAIINSKRKEGARVKKIIEGSYYVGESL